MKQDMKLAPPFRSPWLAAMETQLEAFKLIDKFVKNPDPLWQSMAAAHGFALDHILLQQGVPFAWSKESTEAVFIAKDSIPEETVINHWNLNRPAAWWYFEEPLPITTLRFSEEEEENNNNGVRALSIGWVIDASRNIGAFLCSVWCDNINPTVSEILGTITPSQTWYWYENESLSLSLERARGEHTKKHDKETGTAKNLPHTDTDLFVETIRDISKFILAALTWINQKIIVTTDGHIERHRRKDFNRVTKQNLSSIQLVSLRKVEHTTEESLEPSKVNWSHRWVVSGHFRNQVCGPGRHDRKLIYINPFIKGPEDKPIQPPKAKVYQVNR